MVVEKIKKGFHLLVGAYLLLILGNIQAQNSPLAGSLVIRGKINGVASGTVSVTTEVFGDKKSFEAPIRSGNFEVRINQPSPTLYSLVVKEDPRERLLLFADNGIAQIDANKGDLGNGKVSGSISNREFSHYNTMVSNYDYLLNTIQQVWSDLEEKGELMPKVDSLQFVYRRTTERKDSAISVWVMQHNKSFVSPLVMVLNYANNGEAIPMRTMFDQFTPEVKTSYYGNFLQGVIIQKEEINARMERVNVGKVAPSFSQTDPDGKPISLESFRGKYVLVDFWASWCGPCRQENPNLVRTYEKFKDRNLEILGVSLDNNKSNWLKAIKDDQLTWPHVSDLQYWKNEVAILYGVTSIPANFLLDKDGKIIARNLRGPALEQTLGQLLKPLP